MSEAAIRYLEVAHLLTISNSNAEDIVETLRLASVCAVLATPSPQRDRALSSLHSEDRCRVLSTWPIIDKVHQHLLLRGKLQTTPCHMLMLLCADDDVKLMETQLQPHHRVTRADQTGTQRSLLAQSVLVHNMICLSELYQNLSLRQVAKWLQLPDTRAVEQLCISLVNSGVITAQLDQLTESVHFMSTTKVTSIGDVCNEINSIVETLSIHRN